MFSNDTNGYKRREVDDYIANLKSSHEKSLMEERLKVLEAEKKMLDLRKQLSALEERDKNMRLVLQSFKHMQNEGNNNIEILRGEQLRLVYLQLQEFMRDLHEKFPGVLVNNSYKKLTADIENILSKSSSRMDQIGTSTENDAMRLLLSKMQGKRIQESPKEVRIERTNDFRDKPSQIKPVTEMSLKAGDGYDNLVDKYLATRPQEEQSRALPIQSSGFDLKEAITPKADLSEIMKAFDFFNNDDDDETK